jgi:hypothetical protein
MLPNGIPMKGEDAYGLHADIHRRQLRRNDDSMKCKCWYLTAKKIPLPRNRIF